MFEFMIKGLMVGFNTSRDGARTYMKIQSVTPAPNGHIQRDERPGSVDVMVSPQVVKGAVSLNSLVVVRGRGSMAVKPYRNAEGKDRQFDNFRFEADSVEVANAAPVAKN